MNRFSLIVGLLSFPLLLHADANRQDWVGDYAMNHDGHLGTLHIVPSHKKCRSIPCLGLEVEYSDDRGSTYSGSVRVLDENGQHMAFTVNFPGRPQVFNVYIFSFDKTKLAGTTVWQGRTFGVLASKSGAAPAAVVANSGGSGGFTHVLLPNGTIELHSPDGSVRSKRIGGCGWTTRYPDGSVRSASCITVAPVIPPAPPSGSDADRWLNGQDKQSLGILQGLLGGANSSSYRNYLRNYENPPNPSLYQRIYFRMQAISDFVSIQP